MHGPAQGNCECLMLAFNASVNAMETHLLKPTFATTSAELRCESQALGDFEKRKPLKRVIFIGLQQTAQCCAIFYSPSMSLKWRHCLFFLWSDKRTNKLLFEYHHCSKGDKSFFKII